MRKYKKLENELNNIKRQQTLFVLSGGKDCYIPERDLLILKQCDTFIEDYIPFRFNSIFVLDKIYYKFYYEDLSNENIVELYLVYKDGNKTYIMQRFINKKIGLVLHRDLDPINAEDISVFPKIGYTEVVVDNNSSTKDKSVKLTAM